MFWKRFFLAGISLFVAFLITELVFKLLKKPSCLQVDRKHSTYFSLGTGYKLTPHFKGTEWGGTDFSINSIGLRDKEIEKEKKTNEYRILCLGNSCTFGAGGGIKDEETYPQVLEILLRSSYPDKNIEVINAGIPGYSSFQMLLLLKSQKLYEYSPDIITVYIGWGDYWPSRVTEKEAYYLRYLSYWFNKSRFLSHLYWLIKNERYLFLEKCRFFNFRRERPRAGLKEYKNNIRGVVDIAKKNKAKTILFTIAPRSDAGCPNIQRIHSSNKILKRIAEDDEVYLLDLYKIFKSWRSKRFKQLFADPIHPSVGGHRIIAREIFDLLEETGLHP